MNEEKLDKIYEKLLDLEIGIKDIQNEKRLKEFESEKRDIQYRIDDTKYMREKQMEYKEEMMTKFRNLKSVEEENNEI